jgi:hypothetical protein
MEDSVKRVFIDEIVSCLDSVWTIAFAIRGSAYCELPASVKAQL